MISLDQCSQLWTGSPLCLIPGLPQGRSFRLLAKCAFWKIQRPTTNWLKMFGRTNDGHNDLRSYRTGYVPHLTSLPVHRTNSLFVLWHPRWSPRSTFMATNAPQMNCPVHVMAMWVSLNVDPHDRLPSVSFDSFWFPRTYRALAQCSAFRVVYLVEKLLGFDQRGEDFLIMTTKDNGNNYRFVTQVNKQ